MAFPIILTMVLTALLGGAHFADHRLSRHLDR